jgi:phosphatidylserine/phosphatidylglycerophosphate/cardiolipin synthase-like enzyme
MNLLSGSSLSKIIDLNVSRCNQIDIISAYVTEAGCNKIVSGKRPNQQQIRLIGRFSPNDFISGASSIKALIDLHYADVRLYLLRNLHAKIYCFDRTDIYVGSANFTANGLSIARAGNIEACTQVEANDLNLLFIEKLFNNAVILDFAKIIEMQDYLEMNNDLAGEHYEWPDELNLDINNLFISDLPLCMPNETADLYLVNKSLDFAVLESLLTFEDKAEYFYQSKIYRWIRRKLILQNSLSFGAISKLLHEELFEDPKPRRHEIKTYLQHLYAYINKYAAEEIEIKVPGRRSQVLFYIGERHE